MALTVYYRLKTCLLLCVKYRNSIELHSTQCFS